jgi:OOP family OmpA-OmpF porin
MRPIAFAAVAAALLCSAGSVLAADIPGGKDPPGLKRYEGSQIIHHAESRYAAYPLGRDASYGKTESVEGEVQRVLYLVPEGVTSLEVLRNYEQMLSDSGFEQTFELKTDAVWITIDAYCGHFFYAFEKREVNSTYKYCGAYDNPNYATYKAIKDGKNIAVAVFVGEARGMDWVEPSVKKPIPVKKGQVIAALDVITGKAAEIKMVEVKAADIADALATKGSIDLYGIYFDIDKTDIKPESTKTLDEVASLLKIDRSLKLEISGHTDNTGTAEHNMKLSEGRAQAVVDALVKKYGIDAARLEAKGYGDTKPVASNDTDDGKAKNRRVELKKL